MESLVGARLGRFRIQRLIGRGGMGEVYAATDENLDREIAIKVLSDAVNVEPHRRRFLREARLAARLNHPNIASIHEIGDSDGRLYIVMELLDGQSLRSLLAERRLTQDESVSIARDVARALGRAHASDVIHRDVKPENVVVTHPAPNVLFAKVLDFGLAQDELFRRRGDQESTATDFAAPGEAFGTAGYLAPEQARGLPVDARADVFSCGALLYEMLTGKRAFDGKNPLARMLAVVKSTPVPLRNFAPDVSLELEAITMRCLAKDPAERFADGTELLAALDALTRTSGVIAAAPAREASVPPAAAAPLPTAPAALEIEDSAPPSVRSEAPPAGARPRGSPLFLVAAICAITGAALIATALAIGGPRAGDVIRAAEPRSSFVVGGRAVDGRRDLAPLPAAGPVAEAKRASASDGEGAPAPPPRPRAVAAALHASSSATSAPPARADVAPPPPRPSAEPPRTGTVQVHDNVMAIVVDGEHRRVRDGVVVLPCGRHRIRVGFKDERSVDVPCGGTTGL